MEKQPQDKIMVNFKYEEDKPVTEREENKI